MVTWPAETLEHGAVVAPVELVGDRRQTTIKGSFYRDATRWVQPASLLPQVSELVVEPHQIRDEELSPFADVPPAGSPLFELPYLKRYMYTFKWSLARARTVEAVTLSLAAQRQPDAILSYFQCADTMGHRFWIFKESTTHIAQRLTDLGLPTQNASELRARFAKSFEACYRDLDARVGRILEATQGPDTLVLVFSDHGFGHCERPHPFKSEPYGGVHLDQGVLLAMGPGITPGQWVEGASILDITPTVLRFLGLPVARDMRGRVLEQLLPPAMRGPQSAGSTVETYEHRAQLDCPHADGYPKRKGPLRPTSAQMNGRNPYDTP
jgi:hypothetical protein